ncbi:MAG: type VII secretion protein EssB/YukC [Erysipelotrichaceae bacterium]
MGNTLTKGFKKSAIRANCDYDYCQVEQKRDYFMKCSIEQKEDELVYEFELADSIKLEELKKRSLVYRYLFLINIYLLKDSKEKLDFSIHPDNLYFNANVIPCVLMRDVYQENQYDESIFVKEYKSLIGYLLGDKYTFDDYYNGGEKLLQKHKTTSPFYELSDIDQIKSKLNVEFNKFEEIARSTKVEVNKKGYRNLKIYSRASAIIILVLAIVTGYFTLFKIPENDAIMKSNESFIAQDYITTMESLENVTFDNLTKNSKYIYAVSYIKSDALSNEQKNNILASVTLTSNDKILDYWIHLSRKNFAESIDLAKQLGNKQYLLYGYLKQKSYTETDGALSGSERETKLKEIESSIKELTDDGIKSPSENEEVKEGN